MPKKITSKKIISRKKKQKNLLIEQFSKIPIVQVACEKTGISRATYYRWCKEDRDFNTEAEQALEEGVGLVNDMAESQLISLMKNKNLTANIFWLKHRHRAYKTRVEISGQLDTVEKPLTSEQKKQIKEALSLSDKILSSKPKQS